jgi:hypothetical protein
MLSSPRPQSNAVTSEECRKRFYCITPPTLSHLLALILQPRPDFLRTGTSLLIIEGVNALIDLDYPRFPIMSSNKTEQQKWQSGRRYAVLGSLISALNKLAVLNNLAVVVTTGCASRMRSDSGLGSALVPGVGGTEWDSGIWTRLVVFRDFSVPLIGLQKCQGRSLISREEVGETGSVIGFEVDTDGLLRERQRERGNIVQEVAKAVRSPVKPRKRTFDEVADSEGEDEDEYGWADTDDDALAAEALAENGGATPEQVTEGRS